MATDSVPINLSVFDLFKIGIGPSSSHTVGPMVAARRFLTELASAGRLARVDEINIHLYGSLARTGFGHGTDRALLLGLLGETPDGLDPGSVPRLVDEAAKSGMIALLGGRPIAYEEARHLHAETDAQLPLHPNGMTFVATDAQGDVLARSSYYSVGGGFVLSAEELSGEVATEDAPPPRYPFDSMATLMACCDRDQLSIAEVILANELQYRTRAEIEEGLVRIWQLMEACINDGCVNDGVLPGKLRLKRRAPKLYRELQAQRIMGTREPLAVMDWVSVFALAVNEQNAAGARIVTAPTNGSAGVVPAVLAYYTRLVHTPERGEVRRAVIEFLLTAAAVAMLFKRNASISAAEVGCQGEIGVACSMAAAALTAVMGGSVAQIENAAEIGMEHNLGLTCDPVGGLVQIPCIERNTMGAVKAINASKLALLGDGHHYVSLDQVIRTMKETGADMQAKYKETAEGGLAVNIVEC